MENKQQYFFNLIDSKCSGAIPLFIVKVGSQAYGTNLPSSDEDYAFIYIQREEDIYGFGYREQIDEKKEKGEFNKQEKDDTVGYEIKRFLELCKTNNPTILSILASPEDCIIYKHPAFDLILQEKEKFITKLCKNSFAGYAIAQCRKAKGQNKKQNWEKERMERKTVLDFCFVPHKQGSIPIKTWLSERGLKQEYCGLVNIPHMKYTFGVFYDITTHGMTLDDYGDIAPIMAACGHNIITDETCNYMVNECPPAGYKGIVSNEEIANDISLSSVPEKDELPICHMQFNKDGYSTHCKEYREYLHWQQNKNEQRWVDVKEHGQKIDGKNILHLVRLLRMSREIAEGKGFIIRRPDAEYLKSIRRGEVDLQSILDWAEEEIKIIDELFENSNLPEEVDRGFVNDLLVKIRKEIYNT